MFVKFFYIELHNYVNSKPLAEQHYEEYVELAAVIFFVPPSPPFEFFLLRGAGGQHHFPQIEKKNHFITNFAIFDEKLAKNYQK